MAINVSSIRADVFKGVLAAIKANLTIPNVKVTNAFVSDVSKFPQVVLEVPKVPKKKEAFGVESVAYMRDGSIDIEIYAKTMQGLVELMDDVEQALDTATLDVKRPELGEGSPGHFELEGTTIHYITMPLTFKLKV